MTNDVQGLAAEIAATPEPALSERLVTLAQDPQLALGVGVALRDCEAYERADRLLSEVIRREDRPPQALWDLGYSRARQGDPAGALTRFEQWMVESGSPVWQRLHVAAQHARLGDEAKALAMLDEISLAEPWLKVECMAEAQFYKLLRRYPRSAAEEMFAQMRQAFAPATAPLVEATVLNRLRQREPYLMLRYGDGEAAATKIDLQDEQEYALLYSQNRRDFLDIWFRDKALLDDPRFESTLDAFNAAMGQADCLGLFSEHLIEVAYRRGSRRDVVWVVNTMRRALAGAARDPAWAARTQVVEDLSLHYDLLLSGALERILRAAPHVGLVTCHAGLPEAMRQRFGLASVELHKVPGEQLHAAALGPDAVHGVHWPHRYDELCATLGGGARSGQLFLVAAGLLGKIYGARLKQSGAVVLDIGAVADLMMNKRTRGFPEAGRPHVLVPEAAPMRTQPLAAPPAPDAGRRSRASLWLRRLGRAARARLPT